MDRHWGVAALLLLLPLLVYSNTIFSRYGFRDDYSILREANEEPGKVIMLCSSHARPLYGWLLETSFSQMDDIDDLWAGRAAGALCVGAIAVLLYFGLLRLGWPSIWSAFFAALMAMAPAAQVDVSWAICWPHVVSGICGIAGFLVANQGRPLCRLAGVFLVTAAALIYQPNSLFYLVPAAAGLFSYRHLNLKWRIRWITTHLIVVGSALILAFVIMQGLYAADVIRLHRLVSLETDFIAKLDFFITKPFLNALAMFALNDTREGISVAYVGFAVAVGLTILAGGFGEFLRRGWHEGVFWAVSLVVLCISASAPILIASLRWSTYRTIYPLTGVCLVFFVLGLFHLNEFFNKGREWLVPTALAVMVALAAPVASLHAYTLFALPQQQELALIEDGVKRLQPKDQSTIFVIRPDTEDAPAPGFFSDEFGSLSTDSDWAAREMLKLVVRERFPYLRDLYKKVNFISGHRLPLRKSFDVVIDMRQLRNIREQLASEEYSTSTLLLKSPSADSSTPGSQSVPGTGLL
jgi:hypothetical protein